MDLARQLLALEGPVQPALARRLVAPALGRDPHALPDWFRPQDLRPGGDSAVAELPLTSAFAVVDLETTGLSVQGAAILEIGAVRVRGLRTTSRFETLVRPAGGIPAPIVRLTGIHEAMVADAPTRPPALRAFRRWLDRTPTAPFVAHNAGFDHGFVRNEFAMVGLTAYAGPVLCTRRLARRVIPALGRYDLDHLCAHFGIANRARHRALGDAEATARALIELLRLARTRHGITTIGGLIDLQERPPPRRKRRRRTARRRR